MTLPRTVALFRKLVKDAKSSICPFAKSSKIRMIGLAKSNRKIEEVV